MKKLTIAVSLTTTLLFAVICNAAPAKTETDNIDAAYSVCIDKSDGVTANMNDCSGTAIGKMDKRLNQLYKTLLTKLPPAKQAKLKNAQKKWLAWRAAEEDLSYTLDPNEGGTLQTVSANGFAYEMLKRRVREFEGYLAGLEL
jgi:uncharacterized protein YecT (DUF1311 family)